MLTPHKMAVPIKENNTDGCKKWRFGFFCLAAMLPAVFLFGGVAAPVNQWLPSLSTMSNLLLHQPVISTYHRHKTSQFLILPKQTCDLIFVGDSLTDWGHWHELLPTMKVANRGIAGDTTRHVLSRLGSALSIDADIAVIMLGINDLRQKRSVENTFSDYVSIIEAFSQRGIPVVIQSTLLTGQSKRKVNKQVRMLNEKLMTFARQNETVAFLDLNSILAKSGILSPQFTEDDLHINGHGYIAWSDALRTFLTSTFK